LKLAASRRKNELRTVRGKRGISNIIGEVLVLAIVIGLMTGVIVFYNALVGPIQQESKSTAQQAEASLKERFLIEDVQFRTDASVKITIFNFGDISLSVATVYINGIMLNPPPPSNLIGLKQSGSFAWAYSWSSGDNYHVKVVTGRGTISEADFSSP
jgi:hypothetical protein